MYAQEFVFGQHFLHGLHRQVGDQWPWFVVEIEKHIVFHAVDIGDLVNGDVSPFPIDPDENGIGLLGLSGCLLDIKLFSRLFYRAEELVVSDRLQEEVERIHLITLEGIFLKGSDEDDASLFGQAMRQFHAVYIGHLDVEEQQVGLLFLDGVDGTDGVCKRGQKMQVWRLLHVGYQQADGQWLVIDNHTSKWSHRRIEILT